MKNETIVMRRVDFADRRRRGVSSLGKASVLGLYVSAFGVLSAAVFVGVYAIGKKPAPATRPVQVVAVEPPVEAKPVVERSEPEPVLLTPSADPFRFIRPEVIRATVRIRAGDSTGSGVIVGNRGGCMIVATASHVLRGDRIYVYPWPFEGLHTGRVVQHRFQADLCLLEVPWSKPLPGSVRIAARQDEPGSQLVLSSGCPHGRHPTTQVERLVGYTSVRWRDGVFYTTDDKVSQPGTSGGPLVNTDGQLIGVRRGKGVFASHMELIGLIDAAGLPDLLSH